MRCTSFNAAQSLLGAIYRVVCDVAEETSKQDVDVRIVLLTEDDQPFGPVISVEQLAEMHDWAQLLCPRQDIGYQLQGQFLASAVSPSMIVNYVSIGEAQPGGEPFVAMAEEAREEEIFANGEEHSTVAVGGTFDHLHLGHKLLLTSTAYLLNGSASPLRLVVGLTGSEMLKEKKHSERLEPWATRAHHTLEFLKGIIDTTSYIEPVTSPKFVEHRIGNLVGSFEEWRSPDAKDNDDKADNDGDRGKAGELKGKRIFTVEFEELKDPFGPAVSMESITALVVTKETESGGAAVNKKREEHRWKPLDVAVVDLLMDVNCDQKLSSTRLRQIAAGGDTANNTPTSPNRFK